MRRRLTDQTVKRLKPPADRPYEDHLDLVVPGLGLRVNAGGRRAWHLRLRANGRQQRFAIGNYPAVTLAEARRAAREIIEVVEQGRDPKLETERKRRIAQREQANTVGILAETFISRHVNQLRSGREIERVWRKDILPILHDRPVSEVTRPELHQLLDGIAERGAPVHANRVQAYLSRFMNWALDREYVAANPLHRMQKRTDERSRRRDRVLTAGDVSHPVPWTQVCLMRRA